ncbi:ABC transporter permease [Congregicoccus parvus]|uniref:ABC transporter permease n=1 Tax=Congregicoccus parvus TaxID=3081749 RepID=UPI003FA55049
MLSVLVRDLRSAARRLSREKAVSATALVTLALCIGATTAIFSTVYSLMLKPLPFHEPEAIVELYTSASKAGLHHMPANVPIYLDYSANARSYESLALWSFTFMLFGDDTSVVRVAGARATAEIFRTLRVQPLVGGFFTKEQNVPGADKVVVLTQSYWKTEYDEDPAVIGREIRIDGEAYTVVGVAPRVFEAFDARVKYVVPLSWNENQANPRGRYGVGLQLFGRLLPGVGIGQADAEAKTLERVYVDASPPPVKDFVERSGMTMNVGGVQDQRVDPVRPTLLMLQGGAAFVLLIGCVNVANLLLVRTNARQSELAIRAALGAGRASIARQLLVESLFLTSHGAALGLGLAWGALRVTNFYLAKMLPQSLPASLDLRVLAFAVGLALVVGVLIGLIPIFHVLRTNLAEVIQRGTRGSSAGRGVRLLSNGLVVGQVAVAIVLLTGAGLLVHSFMRAMQVDPGMRIDGVVTGRIALPQAYRASDEAASGIRQRLLQGLREIPGVESVALGAATPFQGGLPINAFTLAEDSLPPGSPQPGAFRVLVSPGYAETLGLQLVEGRFYEEADLAPQRNVFVVDESFAKRFFPGQSALGGRFSFGGRPENDADWPGIVGVVRDVPHNGVEEKSGNPFIYQLVKGGRPGGLTLFLHTSRSSADTLLAMREKLRSIDPSIPLFDTGSLRDAVGDSFDNRRAVMLLLAAFAGLALFLSALGIYGVLAYDVSQRTREIGIRSALGASRGQVLSLVLLQGLVNTAIGLGIGLVGAFVLSRYMTALLFGVKPTDPWVYVAVSLGLAVVALVAGLLPARRASRIDPLVALRDG